MHVHTSDQSTLRLGIGDYTCNWGVHIAGLYETEAERDDILLGFLHEGALARDLQLYCMTERSIADFGTSYEDKFDDRTVPLLGDERVFRLKTARELYYPTGIFSPWDMDDGLNAFFADSQRHGPRNVRATAEMAWALEAIPGSEHLMAYESRLNYFVLDKPWISICLYDVTRFSGAVIMDVLRTHPYTINGGVITENPYYQNPDVWLAANAPEFLCHE